ncbi:hypothetical protein llap_14518 [Limosa lapponica baueri]|uniref:Uncharacterized protein n=1 Tax=Limosa lapponica baueri TaxID=1758121 RepID=A0A2I0TN06_LIMLA|nr:hypothetical protein llap_14518 [Limosa lapponica baueri]
MIDYFLVISFEVCIQSGVAFPAARRSSTPPSLLHHVLDCADGGDSHGMTLGGCVSSWICELEHHDIPTSLPTTRPCPAEGSSRLPPPRPPSQLRWEKLCAHRDTPCPAGSTQISPFKTREVKPFWGRVGKTLDNRKEERESADYSRGTGMALAKLRAGSKKEKVQRVVQKTGHHERRKDLSK